MGINFKKQLRKFCFFSLIIIIIAEVFIFNYKAFLINPFNSSRYEQQEFSLEDAEIVSATDTSPVTTVTFNMDTPVKTMYLDISSSKDDAEEYEVSISFATDGYKDFRNGSKSFNIIDSISNSKYVTCSYSGNVQKIQLTLEGAADDADSQYEIRSLVVNKKIPIHFSLARVLILFMLGSLIFIFVKYPAFREIFDLNKPSHLCAVCFTIFCFLCLILFTYNLYVGQYNWFKNTAGDQMTKGLVDAFEAGQVSLLDKVPAELLELENPYDWSERIAADVDCKWDTLLYEGKYYSYYGIAPVITLFLPYHLITGYYFSSSLACLLFASFAVIFIGLCFVSIVKNWFEKTPLRLVVCGMITTMFSSCALICVIATQFYEVAQSSALCFLVIGFYFMLNSGIFTKKEIRLKYMFLSSLFVSLAVLSRATSALYAIAMVFWIIFGYFQYTKDKKRTLSASVKYIIASLLPYVIFGAIQMAYNYLRFGNPFEFGIQYSLTLIDLTSTEMHLSFIMTSIVNYLLIPPVINSTFPFVHGNFDSLSVNGFYFRATKPTFGILPSVLPILSLFYAPKLAKNFNLKEKIKLFFIWFVPGILIPFILVIVTWECGYAMRYNADFGWQLCIAAFILIFYVYNRLNNETIKKWLFRILFTATIWCAVCYIAGAYTGNPFNAVAHNTDGAVLYYKIKDLIEFWN